MLILDEFRENKTLVQGNLEQAIKAVAQLKQTLAKLQQYEQAAQLREYEKQLEEIKGDVFALFS